MKSVINEVKHRPVSPAQSILDDPFDYYAHAEDGWHLRDVRAELRWLHNKDGAASQAKQALMPIIWPLIGEPPHWKADYVPPAPTVTEKTDAQRWEDFVNEYGEPLKARTCINCHKGWCSRKGSRGWSRCPHCGYGYTVNQAERLAE